jgi:hypothetical protein
VLNDLQALTIADFSDAIADGGDAIAQVGAASPDIDEFARRMGCESTAALKDQEAEQQHWKQATDRGREAKHGTFCDRPV